MSSVKISALPEAATITGGETVPVVQDGETRRATASQIATFTGALLPSNNLSDVPNDALAAENLSVSFVVADLAALKALGSRPGAVIVETGQAAGTWRWESGSVTTADDALVVQPTSGTAGRYKRIYDGPIHFNWFGAVGDGVTDDTVALQAAIDSLDSTVGGTIHGSTTAIYLTSAPLVIDTLRVAIVGYGGAGDHQSAVGATNIRGSHLTGPVIRAKKSFLRLENLVVSATAARTAATMIDRTNYGADRDSQNYGIWIEPDDTASAITADNLPQIHYFKNVWVTGQPNTNWAIITGAYSSVIDHCASTDSKGHGIVISSGAYTDRTNVLIPGVMEIRTWGSIGNAGHGFVAGTPDDAGAGASTFRLTIDNLDMYNNCTNAALLYDDYVMYFVSDNSSIINSAMNGGSTYGALYLHGRNIGVENIRVLNMPDSPAPGPVPIKVGYQHGTASRVTQGIDIDTITCPQGTHVDLVEVVSGATDVSVRVKALDGTFSGLSAGAHETDRIGVKKWDGSLQVPTLLSGKSTADSTNAGFWIDASGFFSAVRSGNAAGILNRLASNGDLLLLRQASVDVGAVGAAITTSVSVATTIYTLSATGGGAVLVSGAFNDAGTIRRFTDLVMYITGGSPTVIGFGESNTPAARTYTASTQNLQLAMASNTYTVRAVGLTARSPL